MSRTIRSLTIPVAAIVLFQACALIIRSYARVQLLADNVYDLTAKYVSYLVVPVILLVLCYPIVRDNRAYLRSLFTFDGLTSGLVIKSVFSGMLLYVAYTYCYLLLYAIEQSPGVSISLIEDRTLFQFCDPAASLAMGLIVGALLTPLVEEVTNRGLIFPGMLKYGVFKAIIFSSVVFALCHKPSSIITAFGFGLYANIVFLRTGQLWFSFITHATYNSLVISNEYCDFAIRAPMMMVTTREWLIISALTITGLAAFGMYKLLPDKPDQ